MQVIMSPYLKVKVFTLLLRSSFMDDQVPPFELIK